MTTRWTWKEGFRFALAAEFRLKDEGSFGYKMSSIEKIGTLYLKPLYRSFHWISSHIRKPSIIIFATLLVAFLVALTFYNLPTFVLLGKLFPSKWVRFLFFLYIETTLLSLGCRAIGRFSNTLLVDLWKKGQLVPIFPGDD